MAKTILLVCTGNTCRSSMAEALLKKMLAETKYRDDYTVISAGLAARPGDHASDHAIAAMADEGLDLSGHRARQLTPGMVDTADLVLTMTSGHKQAVLELVPNARGKVFTLKEYAQSPADWVGILTAIHAREDRFIRENQGAIEQLRNRRDELLRELSEVENKLQHLEDAFLSLFLQDRAQMQGLQGEAADTDIADPFGGSAAVYRACAQELKAALSKSVARLTKDSLPGE